MSRARQLLEDLSPVHEAMNQTQKWKLHLQKLMSTVEPNATEIHKFLLQRTSLTRTEAWNMAQALESIAIDRDKNYLKKEESYKNKTKGNIK